MAAVPAGAKLHRFAPTRELIADYETVVPANVRSREKTRVLRRFLKQTEDENVTGKNDKLMLHITRCVFLCRQV